MRSFPAHARRTWAPTIRVLVVLIGTSSLLGMHSRTASASEMVAFNCDLGDKLDPFRVVDSTGKTTVLNAETPTVVVLWASWSESSKSALRDLIKSAPQSGIRWTVVPIDAEGLGPATRSSASGTLRSLGYTTGGIWRDPDMQLESSWGIHTVPTVIMTGLGGFIVKMTVGWNDAIRDSITAEYFASTPTKGPAPVQRTPVPITPAVRRMAELRRHHRQGQSTPAVDSIAELLRSDSTVASADAARLLLWRVEEADTAGLSALTDSVLVSRPRNPWLLLARSLDRFNRRDWLGAQSDSKEALGMDSACTPALTMVALASLELGDTALAQQGADAAWGRNHSSPRLLALKARLAGAKGQPKAEAQWWQWAVEASMHLQQARPAGSTGRRKP
jgi:hypothetical protein